MSGLGKIFDSNFRTDRDEQQDTLPQIHLQKPSKSWFGRVQLAATKVSFFSRVNPRKVAQRLLGPCPHLPPLPLQPPHPLLSPLGPHCSKSPLLRSVIKLFKL